MGRTATIAPLVAAGVVPVVRTTGPEAAERAILWLAAAGMTVIEITLTVPGALELIEQHRSDGGAAIGAGTIRTPADVDEALRAGARFLVSPAFVEGMAEACAEAGIPAVIGALTPSEVLRAHGAGADAVKVFPVGNIGGAKYVKVLRSIFPDIALAPTGGIAVDEIGSYLNAGADFVGLGGNLVDETALKGGHREIVEAVAREALAQVKQFRFKEHGYV